MIYLANFLFLCFGFILGSAFSLMFAIEKSIESEENNNEKD